MARMTRLSRYVMAAALLAALACVLPARAATPLTVETIRRGGTDKETRIVVETSAGVPYRAFLLANPNRLVVDVPAARWQAPRASFFDGGLAKGYRSGDLDGGLTRVVFDLSQPALIKKSFTLPAAKDAKARLVIDLAQTSQNIFNARLDEVQGDANLRQKQVAAAPAETNAGYHAAEDKYIAATTRTTVTTTTTTTTANTMLPVPKPQRFAGTNAAVPAAPLPPMSARHVIILDAGHGGHDPGAISSGVQEKDLTLGMVKAVRDALEATGRYKVVLTRDTDIFIPLRERVAIARAKGGELFISIHADKVPRTQVRGTSLYTLSEVASDKETERLADQENNAGMVAGVDLSGEEADVADILLDLAMREKMNESSLLARFIEDSLRRKNIKLLPNSHRSAGFAVLKAPDVPSVLIEMGFLSNPDEAKLLASNGFRKDMAGALRDAIDGYFTKIVALQKI